MSAPQVFRFSVTTSSAVSSILFDRGRQQLYVAYTTPGSYYLLTGIRTSDVLDLAGAASLGKAMAALRKRQADEQPGTMTMGPIAQKDLPVPECTTDIANAKAVMILGKPVPPPPPQIDPAGLRAAMQRPGASQLFG